MKQVSLKLEDTVPSTRPCRFAEDVKRCLDTMVAKMHSDTKDAYYKKCLISITPHGHLMAIQGASAISGDITLALVKLHKPTQAFEVDFIAPIGDLNTEVGQYILTTLRRAALDTDCTVIVREF